MRPWRLQDVVHDLSKNGIVGMTASNVMGVGVQRGAPSGLWRKDLTRMQRCRILFASLRFVMQQHCSPT